MHGQTANTGAIAGTVSDPSGALVARAAIVVKSQATQEERDLATDVEGNFSVPFLTLGNYDLTVRAPGFEPLVLNGVQVRITEVSRLKIQLTIGGAKEQIAVSAKPPLVQTENATLGRVIDQETVVDLPLVDRNFTEILGLTAGTNTDIVDATQLGAGSLGLPRTTLIGMMERFGICRPVTRMRACDRKQGADSLEDWSHTLLTTIMGALLPIVVILILGFFSGWHKDFTMLL